MGVCGIKERATSYEVPTTPQHIRFTGDQSAATDRETSGVSSLTNNNTTISNNNNNTITSQSENIESAHSDVSELPVGSFMEAGSIIEYMMADRETFDSEEQEEESRSETPDDYDEVFSRSAGRFLSSSDYTVFYLDEEQQLLGELETIERFDQRGNDHFDTPCQRDEPYENYEELMPGRHRRSGNERVHPADLHTIRDRVHPLTIYGWPSSPLDIPGRRHTDYFENTYKISAYIQIEAPAPVNNTTVIKNADRTTTEYGLEDPTESDSDSDEDESN